ncbi:cyclophilin-like fold protein [uncultured Friedmanniella sp.]|uniref:cyclophilin-like fold protein n=1 Tax=uncultured Friedmanniella sp. TaxID=335381 RepID=UPI0035CC2D85
MTKTLAALAAATALAALSACSTNAGIEYITELDAPMTETGPFYTDVEAGDIVYYNPMDSITVIYAPTSSVPTLTTMGEVSSDLAAFQNLPDSVDMRIERA